MKVLGIGQGYLSQSAFRDVFAVSGHETYSVGWYHGEGLDLVVDDKYVLSYQELLERLPKDFVPDAIVYFDHSELPRVTGLEELEIPTLTHLVDIHLHWKWHPAWSGCFDNVLLAMKGYSSHFVKNSPFMPAPTWFPLWATNMGADPTQTRPIDVSFRGSMGATHPKRERFFKEVGALVQGDFGSGPYFDLYNQSKVVLNDCIKDDLNWRVFEALASGALLLTPCVSPETLELFPEFTSLITYTPQDAKDAAAKAQFYLSHPEERLRVARNGYRTVAERHTAKVRAEFLLEQIIATRSRPVFYKRLSAIVSYILIAKAVKHSNRAISLLYLALAMTAFKRHREVANPNGFSHQEFEEHCILIENLFWETIEVDGTPNTEHIGAY